MKTFHRSQIEIQQDALVNSRQVESMIRLDEHPNAIILKVDNFGFSSNNITYALLGQRFGYWGFFPASEGFGIVPVWGFATVMASNNDNLSIGERVYGYLPMASHLLIHAENISNSGFTDKHEQRKSISPVYDYYWRCDHDPSYTPALETWQVNFRPLFTTAFVLGYSIYAQKQAASDRVFITSASSKTAYATALVVKQLMPDSTIIGLTSTRQLEFVNRIGCYDQVLCYTDMQQAGVTQDDWILDFAGDQLRIASLRNDGDERATKTLLIGATDVAAQGHRQPSAIGEVFFAPDAVRQFNQTWGAETFQQRYAELWRHFVSHMTPFLCEQVHNGPQEIVKQYQQFLRGNVDPTVMHVMKF